MVLEQSSRTDAEDNASCASSLSILFAEDSNVIRQLIQVVLTKRGHRVEAVEDGERALDALQRGGFDVALIDLHLPKLDGLQVAKAYKAMSGDDRTHTQFVGFTADVEGLFAEDCDTFDLIVGKPIDLLHLCSVLEGLGCEGAVQAIASAVPDNDAAGPLPWSGAERRAAHRIGVAGESGMTLVLESGERVTCCIRELSLDGAALQVEARPTIGQRVVVGRTEGRVVRHMQTGIAVEFTKVTNSARRAS